MSIVQHPSDETLMRFASGALGAGPRLVVNVHLASCPVCREQVRLFEAACGALLEQLPPAPVSTSSLEKIFARIDAGEAKPEAKPLTARRRPAPLLHGGVELPAALADCQVGGWRSVHPTLSWSRVRIPGAPGERVILLKFAAGCAAPRHDHRGLELTQVVYGHFTDGARVYGPGDLVEADESVTEHQPRATEDGECLCLAALEAPIRVASLIGRLFQPIMGI